MWNLFVAATFLVGLLTMPHDVDALSKKTHKGHNHRHHLARKSSHKVQHHGGKLHAVKEDREQRELEPLPESLRLRGKEELPALLGLDLRTLRSAAKFRMHGITKMGSEELDSMGKKRTMGITKKPEVEANAGSEFPEIQSGEEFARDYVQDDDEVALELQVEREHKEARRAHTMVMAARSQERQRRNRAAERNRRAGLAAEAAAMRMAERVESRKAWATRQLSLQRERFEELNKEKAILTKAVEQARTATSKAKQVLRQTENATAVAERRMLALEKKEKSELAAFRVNTQELRTAEERLREKAEDTKEMEAAMIEAEHRLKELENEVGAARTSAGTASFSREQQAISDSANMMQEKVKEKKHVQIQAQEPGSTDVQAEKAQAAQPTEDPSPTTTVSPKNLQDTIAKAGNSTKGLGALGATPQALACMLLPLVTFFLWFGWDL